MNFMLDNLIAAEKVKPMLIVMNCGMVQMPRTDGSRIIDAMAPENLLLNDCIPFIEKIPLPSRPRKPDNGGTAKGVHADKLHSAGAPGAFCLGRYFQRIYAQAECSWSGKHSRISPVAGKYSCVGGTVSSDIPHYRTERSFLYGFYLQ